MRSPEGIQLCNDGGGFLACPPSHARVHKVPVDIGLASFQKGMFPWIEDGGVSTIPRRLLRTTTIQGCSVHSAMSRNIFLYYTLWTLERTFVRDCA